MMLPGIFQQRYTTDKGIIIVAQEGLDPLAGEAVSLESGEVAPDGRYLVQSSEWKQIIEVTNGVIHHYYKRSIEKSISTGNSFLVLLLFIIMIFILFKILGNR